jgi:hypothetical protein
VRIVVLPPRGVNFQADSPWMGLLGGLRSAGHEVAEFGAASAGGDAVVVMNDQPAARHLIKELNIPASRAALVVLEPRVTAPTMYTATTLARYGHRFAPSHLWAQELDAEKFPWPQVISTPPAAGVSWEFRATMINAEKRSAVRGSLYGLRREVIRTCDSKGIPLAVFGPGWDSSSRRRVGEGTKAIARALRARQGLHVQEALGAPAIRPANAMGTVPQKSSAFAVAPTAIVIENSLDYVSEKLFDAISAGVAPIYVGPPLHSFGIPSDLAIECEPDSTQVVQTLSEMSEERRVEVTRAGREWLASDDAQGHEISRVLSDLGRTIGERLRA